MYFCGSQVALIERLKDTGQGIVLLLLDKIVFFCSVLLKNPLDS